MMPGTRLTSGGYKKRPGSLQAGRKGAGGLDWITDGVPMALGDVVLHRGALGPAGQRALMDDIEAVIAAAPPFTPVTPRGQPMSVRMTAAGRFGWVSDRKGYRYEPRHPSGIAWPPIPSLALDLWSRFARTDRAPECCLVNVYREGARMGLHQDRDEADLSQPVLSVSLGDEARFRVGGLSRKDPTRSVWLASGDVAVLAGKGRLAFHGIDRVRNGSSTLVPGGGRINLTLRVVT